MKRLLLATLVVAGLLGGAPVHAQAPSVTATCNDGSPYAGATRRGACARHGGVREFAAPASVTVPNPMAPGAGGMPPGAPSPMTAAPPTPTPRNGAAAAGGGPGQVWLNTGTGVYHCRGDRFYGHTRAGVYLAEAEARTRGRPAAGRACGG